MDYLNYFNNLQGGMGKVSGGKFDIKSIGTQLSLVATSILIIIISAIGTSIMEKCVEPSSPPAFNRKALSTGVGIGCGMLASIILDMVIKMFPSMGPGIMSVAFSAVLIITGSVMVSANMTNTAKDKFSYGVLGAGIGYIIASAFMFASTIIKNPLTLLRVEAILVSGIAVFMGSTSLNTYYKCGGQTDGKKTNLTWSWVFTVISSLILVGIIASFIFLPPTP